MKSDDGILDLVLELATIIYTCISNDLAGYLSVVDVAM